MTARILRAAAGRPMPWKNGGGETIELLAHPAGAGLDAFDWRISMARVAADGPFSAFPGVDRTLTVLDGEGLALAIDGWDPVRLTPASPPLGFPADAPCASRLLGGPVTDLNVMTRRGRFVHAVEAVDLPAPRALGAPEAALGGATLLLLCRRGEILCHGLGTLGRHDALVLAGGESVTVEARQQPAAALVVVVRPG